MSLRTWIGIVLLALGTAALAMRGFSYTRETHEKKLGPLEFSVKEKERVEIPVWVGLVLVAGGAAAILVPARKRAE
jgi:uncharacterized membrane protein